MWTVVKVQGTEILRGVLDQWKAGVDAHAPQKVAAVFTEDGWRILQYQVSPMA
jgi:hypothetical protein